MTIDSKLQFIGNLLVEKGFLTKDQIDEFTSQVKIDIPQSQEEWEELLIKKGLISEENLLRAYSQHLDIPYLDLGKLQVATDVLSLIPAKFANRNKVISVGKDEQGLTVAMRSPFNIHIIDELKILTKLNVRPVISKSEDIINAIKLHYGVGAETVETIMHDSQKDVTVNQSAEEQLSEDAEKITDDASIIKYVNQILLEAYQKRATDIHLEPFEHTLRIRYRIDGILQEVKASPEIKKLQLFIISRLKIMANLNIAEKRRPQDGRCKVKLQGEDVDLRLSSFPTLFGEGISIRLLSKSLILLGIEQLGFSPDAFKQLDMVLNKSNGIVLVTGPTGCGKTTTLYACLNYINDAKMNIITLENPIEYQLEGINQIQINPQVDLTFANGLRSILRQDPDIIMVGEIRDLETAQIAIRAALTGHLIFSTLHTNDALATITRLLDLGIEPYLISGTVRAVVAQRLVRKICPECKQEYQPEQKLLAALELDKKHISTQDKFFKGSGCPACDYTGYKGRTGIYEILVIDDKLGSIISSGGSKAELSKQAQANGMQTLKQDGLNRIKAGITTIEEVMRVTEQV